MFQTDKNAQDTGSKQNKRKSVLFSIDEGPNSEVLLAGNFNDWKPEPMKWDAAQHMFVKRKLLIPGFYEYKFVVNGNWVIDHENEDFVYNNEGSMNSIKGVK